MYYRIYGDNSNKLWTKKEVEAYFNIITTKHNQYAECIRNLKGNPLNKEYYSFKIGDIAQVFKTFNNTYLSFNSL